MGDRSLESAAPPSRVSSQANLSLIYDEILFDDDPNRAYFNYMVGMDNLDESLVDGNTLEGARDSLQSSQSVQNPWMNMDASKGTLEYPNYSVANTLEDGSLLAVPRDDTEMAVMKHLSRDANVPPVIYVGQESGTSTQTKKMKLKREKVPWDLDWTGTSTQPKNKELKQDNAFVPGAFDDSPTPGGSFLWKNRRKILVGLSLVLLALAVVIVAFMVTVDHSGDDDPKDASVSAKGSAADGVPSAAPSVPSDSESLSGFTTAPTAVLSVSSSESPVDFPTTSPSESPTDFPTTSLSESPTDFPTTSLAESIAPSMSSSESPTASLSTNLPSLSTNLQDLVEFLSSVSPDGGAALSNPSSPQYNAAKWLSEEPSFVSYSEGKTLQRYALATLYFATNGGQWTNSDGWLTERNECNWYTTTSDEICINGNLRILDLQSNNLQGRLPLELALLSDTLGEFVAQFVAPF